MDEQIWRQLNKDTKSFDYAMQKGLEGMCRAIVPTIKLMLKLKESSTDMRTIKELATDTFKSLAQTIDGTIQGGNAFQGTCYQPTNQYATWTHQQHSFLATSFKKKLTSSRNQKQP